MAKLILSLDGQVVDEFPLTKERTTIGRKRQNDIHIDNLAVSGDHAVVVTIANDCFLEDLGSTNGTRVNGAQVKKRLLRTNDVIELGKYKLTFVDAAAAPAVPAAADYDKTMVWRPPGAKQDAAPAGAMPGGAMPGGAMPAGAMPAGTMPAGATRGAPSQAGAEQDATRKPIWKVGLVVLVILVIVFFTYGTRG